MYNAHKTMNTFNNLWRSSKYLYLINIYNEHNQNNVKLSYNLLGEVQNVLIL